MKNIKIGNYYGFFKGCSDKLILGKVDDYGTFVFFDNYPEPIDYNNIKRIEVNQLNCESLGWRKNPTSPFSYIIDDKSHLIFNQEKAILVYTEEDNIRLINIKYLDGLQDMYRLKLNSELPIKRE